MSKTTKESDPHLLLQCTWKLQKSVADFLPEFFQVVGIMQISIVMLIILLFLY